MRVCVCVCVCVRWGWGCGKGCGVCERGEGKKLECGRCALVHGGSDGYLDQGLVETHFRMCEEKMVEWVG